MLSNPRLVSLDQSFDVGNYVFRPVCSAGISQPSGDYLVSILKIFPVSGVVMTTQLILNEVASRPIRIHEFE